MKSFLVLERFHQVFNKFFCHFAILQLRSSVVILYSYRNKKNMHTHKFSDSIKVIKVWFYCVFLFLFVCLVLLLLFWRGEEEVRHCEIVCTGADAGEGEG